MNSKSDKKKALKAFSLIELSIVILIIGILIAGVTQSSRLIKQFRLSTARTITQSAPVPSIKDLVIWLEPTMEKSFKNQDGSFDIENGNKISSWMDNSPVAINKLSVDQATSANQPTYIVDGVGGLPSVRFDSSINSTQKLNNLNVMEGRNIETTYFAVFKWNDSSISLTQEVVDFGGSNASGSDISHLLYVATDPNASSLSMLFWTGSANDALNQTAANFMKKDRQVIATVKYNPRDNVSALYVGKTVMATGTASTAGFHLKTLTGGFTVGNHVSGTRMINADIAELIVYDRALRNAEISDIQDYLIKKYGIR